MKNIYSICLIILTTFLITGCAYKSYDVNSKHTDLKNGYSYTYPFAVSGYILDTSIPSNYLLDGLIFLNQPNACKYGDFYWIARNPNQNKFIKPDDEDKNPYLNCKYCNKPYNQLTPDEKEQSGLEVAKIKAWKFLNARKQGLAGCTSPNYGNPNEDILIFENGQAFKVPKMSISRRIVNEQLINELNSKNIKASCKPGDIFWSMTQANNGGKSGKFIQFLFNYKRYGCSRPLSDREYNYLMNKNNNSRQQQNYQNNLERQNQFKREQQEKEFEQETKIQNRKSLDKTLDRMNNTSNSLTPINVNVHHY